VINLEMSSLVNSIFLGLTYSFICSAELKEAMIESSQLGYAPLIGEVLT
jgi:hypothetical protein